MFAVRFCWNSNGTESSRKITADRASFLKEQKENWDVRKQASTLKTADAAKFTFHHILAIL